MDRKQTFTVTIEKPLRDDCGKRIPPFNGGDIRRALAMVLEDYDSITVEETKTKGAK